MPFIAVVYLCLGRYYNKYAGLDNLEGYPVLYVHGSGGSYKQARSIGSVLYQKMKSDRRFDFHFNTFSGNGSKYF